MRIVSLACSNTEIVCALGRSDLLVGVDDHSDYPQEAVATLPRVGPDLEIDIPAVAALEPDLVLASLTVPGHERVISGLEAAQLPFLTLEPTSLDAVHRDILTIAASIGAEEAGAELVYQMRQEIPEEAEATPATPPRILVQWWPRPVFAPGRLSWTHDLLVRAGANNPLGGEEIKSRELSDEEVRDIDPQAIVLSWCGVAAENYRPEVVYSNPLWHDLQAVRERRVFCIPEALLGRPGPRLCDGFRALAAVVAELHRQRDDPASGVC